jgi:lysine 6-dehydrogenase
MAFRYDTKIPTMEYKTLRYPGHAAIMAAIRELGLLDLDPVDVKGIKVVPRDAFIAIVGPRLRKPEGRDLVALRVVVEGRAGGRDKRVGWQLIDRYDERTGISAMMRTTGYSLSITGQMQADGRVTLKGVHTPDDAIPFRAYVDELRKRGVCIEEL